MYKRTVHMLVNGIHGLTHQNSKNHKNVILLASH